MIIKKLQLYNFGIYAGENSFDFSLKKPVVLIGGMNGRGKTTFLEAIVLSLYGSNSETYKESGHKTYGLYLRSLVNRDCWDQRAFVELTFIVNDRVPVEYTVHREWNALGKRVSEIIDVSENGKHNEFLTHNWGMFVENIVPSALSSFYFFDGEKIAELALDESNLQLRDSIRSMLGLNTLDILKNDLMKCMRRRLKNHQSTSMALDTVQALKQQQIELAETVAAKEREIECLQLSVTKLQDEIEALQNKYESKGGKVIEQCASLIRDKAEMTSALQQLQGELINLASGELPLILIKDLIQDIKLQAEDEHNDFIMRQLIERVDNLLKAYEASQGKKEKECDSFVKYIKQQSAEEAVEPIYQVSEYALFQLNSLLDSVLERVKQNTVRLLEEKENLQKRLTEIESHLSLDINEDEISKISVSMKMKQKELVEIQVKCSQAEKELMALNSTLNIKRSEVNNAVSAYLSEASVADENARLDKYTSMALSILDEYSVRVQSEKSEMLASTITECYHKLASKQNLIKRISVNPESLEITYLRNKDEQIHSNTLSAGEKQLMVISVLWALAICSKKKLPVIIDTPLSRLDSAHRASVVQNYFPHASEQTIILSTDSEIDRTYYDMMKESVGDEFTLKYDEEKHSSTIVKGYFE